MTEERGKVEQLSDTLYSRTRYRDPLDMRSSVKGEETPNVEEKWHSPELNEMLQHERKGSDPAPFMKKFFIFAILFFVAAIGVAAFVFFGGTNFISSKNVDITVVGATSTSAGEVIDLAVTIANKNNADLELANLSIQYPSGSRDPQDSTKNLTYTREELGVVEAGDEVVRNVRFILLGSTAETKELKFSVEYKVKGSSATFYKDKTYQLSIGKSPLSLSIDAPPSVTSGENFTTTLLVGLNSNEVLRNVVLKAEYPYGYTPGSADPTPVTDNNVWTLGDLSPGSSKKISITGRLLGEDQDERTFRFYVGVSDQNSLTPSVKTVILSGQQTIAIERPSVGLSVNFNGDNSTTYIAPAEQRINAQINYQNNLPDKLLNPQLEVRLSGSALNKNAVLVQSPGTYDAATGRLVWNLLNSSQKPELLPGDNSSVTFSFGSLPQNLSGNVPEINLQISLTGISVETQKPVTVTETRTVKIAAQVTLGARAVYSVGPFVNSGPVPPKVNQETTYTVIWSVGNTQSDLNDAKVSAKLGNKVKWVAAKEVEGEKLTYDAKTNTVTWELGGLSSGLGFSSASREAAFQVALQPSAAQVGTAPQLVNNIVFSALDTGSGKSINISASPLTTKLLTDPAFIQGDDIVVK